MCVQEQYNLTNLVPPHAHSRSFIYIYIYTFTHRFRWFRVFSVVNIFDGIVTCSSGDN